MPLINDNLFMEEWNDPNFRYNISNMLTAYNNWVLPVFQADRKSALKAQGQIRDMLVVVQRQMGKANRPWDLSRRVFEKLNRKEPWWGWEFETGWKSVEARGKALAYTYDTFDGVMYDSEGEGAAPVEITFCPQEQSKFLSGKSDAHKFVKWMEDHPELTYLGDDNNVGTHLNMSHPAITEYPQATDLARFLNRTLWQTVKVNGQRKEMFGRESIYAGFFPQNAGGNVWVEFKGYRTAYTLAEFNNFCKSAAGLQKCVELFLQLPNNGAGKAVDNLYDVSMNGADPLLIDWERTPDMPYGAKRLHTRGFMGSI